MNIRRMCKKSFFYTAKSMIKLLAYFDVRLYMKLYIKILKIVGLNISGTPRYIAGSVRFDSFDLISIGDRCVISANTRLLTHDYSYTTALISIDKTPLTDICSVSRINIGNNVFIGMNSLLLPGTQIGNNVIIGAGSVVRGSIPDNAIVIGNPCFIIGETNKYASKAESKKIIFVKDKK